MCFRTEPLPNWSLTPTTCILQVAITITITITADSVMITANYNYQLQLPQHWCEPVMATSSSNIYNA